MEEPPDLASLAKRYVDLWQENLIAVAADPDFAENIARVLLALGNPAAWSVAAPWPGDPSRDTAAPGPAAAAAPPRDRGDGLDELKRRLAALEERIASLEAGARGRGNGPAPRPRRRRP